MSEAKVAGEDWKETLKTIFGFMDQSPSLLRSILFPANLVFSREILINSLNYCLQMMRKVATDAGRVKAAGNNVIVRTVVLGQAVREGVWFR